MAAAVVRGCPADTPPLRPITGGRRKLGTTVTTSTGVSISAVCGSQALNRPSAPAASINRLMP